MGFFSAVCISAALWGGMICTSTKGDTSDIILANVEALSQNENPDHKYSTKTEDETTIHDDATGLYKTVKITICEGTGTMEC